METYIAILLLIVPGFISIIIFEKLYYPITKKFELELITRSLIFSVFVVLLNYITLILFNGLSIEENNISNLFSSVKFVILYGLVTITWSVYLGYIWGKLSFILNKITNYHKKLYGKTLLNECCVFDSIFDDGKMHLVKVEHDNKIEIGFQDRFRVEEDELKEYSVTRSKDAMNLIENQDIKNTYINGTYKITDYDIDAELPQKQPKWFKKIAGFILLLVFVIALQWLFCFLF